MHLATMVILGLLVAITSSIGTTCSATLTTLTIHAAQEQGIKPSMVAVAKRVKKTPTTYSTITENLTASLTITLGMHGASTMAKEQVHTEI